MKNLVALIPLLLLAGCSTPTDPILQPTPTQIARPTATPAPHDVRTYNITYTVNSNAPAIIANGIDPTKRLATGYRLTSDQLPIAASWSVEVDYTINPDTVILLGLSAITQIDINHQPDAIVLAIIVDGVVVRSQSVMGAYNYAGSAVFANVPAIIYAINRRGDDIQFSIDPSFQYRLTTELEKISKYYLGIGKYLSGECLWTLNNFSQVILIDESIKNFENAVAFLISVGYNQKP